MIDGPSGWEELLGFLRRNRSAPRSREEDLGGLRLAVTVGAASLPGTAGCSLTARERSGRFVTLASSGADATELDHAQYAAQDGPCLRAAVTRERQRVDDLATDDRWPQWGAAATRRGVRSSLSIPLIWGLLPSALNFYGSREELYADDQAVAVASLLARSAAAITTRGEWAQPDIPEMPGATRVLHHRRVIERAQALLVARDRLSPELAHRTLIRRAAAQHRHLAEVAAELLAAPPDRRAGTEADPDDP